MRHRPMLQAAGQEPEAGVDRKRRSAPVGRTSKNESRPGMGWVHGTMDCFSCRAFEPGEMECQSWR